MNRQRMMMTLITALAFLFIGFIFGRFYEHTNIDLKLFKYAYFSSILNREQLNHSDIRVIEYFDLTNEIVNYSRVWQKSVDERDDFGKYVTVAFDWQNELSEHEHHRYSQNGEDGIVLEILNRIGTTNRFYLEFGVENAMQCNTRVLRETKNWTGIMFDQNNANESIRLYREKITTKNVVHILKKHHVPKQFDVFSLDVDYSDFWLMQRILAADYRPRIIIVELNANFDAYTSVTVPKRNADAGIGWDGDKWFGVSLLAWTKLLTVVYGYQLIYAEKNSINAFFIRSDAFNYIDFALVAWVDRIVAKERFWKTNGIHRIPEKPEERPFTHICVRNSPCTSMDLF